MEVILREDVLHLGHIGDIVKVRAGYARNYLLPRGLAITPLELRVAPGTAHEWRLVRVEARRTDPGKE